jgi:hypothetical protein
MPFADATLAAGAGIAVWRSIYTEEGFAPLRGQPTIVTMHISGSHEVWLAGSLDTL